MTTPTHFSHETTRLFDAPAPLFLALQDDGGLRADEIPVYVADDGDTTLLHIESARRALVSSFVNRLPRGKTPQCWNTPYTDADMGGQTLEVSVRDALSTPTSAWRDIPAMFDGDWAERSERVDAFIREIPRWYIVTDKRLLELDARKNAAKSALDEALADLADLDDYAREKSLPPPASLAKESAQKFLRKVVREVPRCYAVSPWDGGKVVVHTRGAKGFGVGVYFNAEGGASCYVTRPGVEGNEEHHYSRLSGFPNEFILAALRELGE